MRYPTLFACLFATVPLSAPAQVTYGNWSTGAGHVQVEEDPTTARYPRHLVILLPQDRSTDAGSLVLRCENNKTEAYFVADQFEFFPFGGRPEIRARFPSEPEAKPVRASNATDNKAAFLSAPIDFILRLAKEDQVVLTGSYYSGRFTGIYRLDDTMRSGIEGMATTCGWAAKMPARASQPAAPATATGPAATEAPPPAPAGSAQALLAEAELRDSLRRLVETHGLAAVLKALGDL